MIYIPLSYVKSDMVLAKDVPAPSGLYALLSRGQIMTPGIIAKLRLHEIDGVYVESEISEDVVPEHLIEPHERRRILSDVRTIYNSFFNKRYIQLSDLDSSKKLAEQLVDTILERDDILLDVIEIKSYDNYTYSHCLNVSMLSVLIAKQIGFSHNRLTDIALCGLMHDIGKIDIPINIINKPGPLSYEEYELIKTHPQNGLERMRKCYNISREVLSGIQCHHEKYSGGGYPYGYKGESIPLFARILAIADVYDALTSRRSYRKAWLPCEAIQYIISQSDVLFDPSLVQSFLRTVCAYPTGTIVELSDGSVAIVSKNHPENVLRPTVRLIECSDLGTAGTEINLCEDTSYLNITVKSALGAFGDEIRSLPDKIFKHEEADNAI
ncbi:MAG: HD-GYP domain-containing protein [Clostridiales bacterium]|nr:HD-GYP domain-containing protein [Clostridiales bacterium]